MLACYLLMTMSSGGAATHYSNYYPYNAYFSSYSAYGPYSHYGAYGCYGCYGFGGGFDPHFSFGCYGGNGCYGWTPPFCAGPPVVHCWSGPVMPIVEEPNGPKKDLTPEQKLDLMLKGIDDMRKDGMKLNQKLLQLEDELIKLKKALPPKGPKPGMPPGGKGAEEAAAPLLKDRALFRIKLPAGAKLYVEGQLTETNGKNERVLVTPKLAAEVHYSYTFRAVSMVDGASVSQTRTVTFQTGEEILVDLESAEPVATDSDR